MWCCNSAITVMHRVHVISLPIQYFITRSINHIHCRIRSVAIIKIRVIWWQALLFLVKRYVFYSCWSSVKWSWCPFGCSLLIGRARFLHVLRWIVQSLNGTDQRVWTLECDTASLSLGLLVLFSYLLMGFPVNFKWMIGNLHFKTPIAAQIFWLFGDGVPG